MPRAEAASHVAVQNPAASCCAPARKAATSLTALLSPARAEASRRNGAKSRGPKTPEGKACSAQNALKHGLRAEKFVVLGDEDPAAFEALEAALMAELVPQGALQAVFAKRIVAATWRLERAERIEGELFAHHIRDTTSFGLALIRDCNRSRAFDTLLRYRGTTLAELWRSLRTLKALQAEAAPRRGHAVAERAERPAPRPAPEQPIKPEARGNPCETAPTATDGPAARGSQQAAHTAEQPPGNRACGQRSGAGAPYRSNPSAAGILAQWASPHLEEGGQSPPDQTVTRAGVAYQRCNLGTPAAHCVGVASCRVSTRSRSADPRPGSG